MIRNLGILLALAATLACADEDGASNHAAEPPSRTPLAIDHQAEVVLGVQDGDPDQTFHDISTPFVLPNGSIAVPTAGHGEIRIFSRRGVLERTLGRPGQGPGEFERLGPAWARGDTIEALDLALQRVTRFIPNEPPDVIRLDGRSVMWGVGGTSDGWILLNLVEPGLARDNPRDQLVIYRFDRQGAYAADLARVEGVQRVSLPGIMAAGLFSPTARFAAWADNLYIGDTLEPEIQIVDGTGTVVGRILVREIVPTPSAALEDVREVLRNRPPTDAGTARLLMDEPLPERLPVFTDFLVDEEGFVWVRPYVPGRDATLVGGNVSFHKSSRGGQWDVASPDGRWVGSVDMPPDLEPYHVTADAVIGIARDELGIERVRVHALTRR